MSGLKILFFSFLALLGLIYTSSSGSLIKYWYLSIIILILSPFNEYYIHKYFLHLEMPKNQGKHPFFVKFLQHIHYTHHSAPKDLNYIFAQFWLTIPGLIFDLLLAYFITGGSVQMTSVIMTALILYYLFYEWSHFLAHSSYTPKNRYSLYMKKYHLLHHYKNENYWYGITNPLADIIFGKFKNPETVEKSPTVKTLTGDLKDLY